MTKLYTTANGKTIRLTEKQFRTLAVAMPLPRSTTSAT